MGLVLLIPIAFTFISIRAPKQSGVSGDSSLWQNTGECSDSSIRFFRKDLLLMYFINFMYMAAEMGLTTWLVEFYITDRHYTAVKAHSYCPFLYYYDIWSICRRLFCVDRIGRFTSMAAASFGVSFCILIGLISSGTTIDDYCLIRTILLIVFPTVTAMLASLPSGNAGRVQGLYFAFGGLMECSTLVHGNYKYIFRFKSRYLPSGTTISFILTLLILLKKADIIQRQVPLIRVIPALCFMLPIACQLFYFQL